MAKEKLKSISGDESSNLVNEVMDIAKVLEQKLRRLYPGIDIAQDPLCEIRFGRTETTTISVDLTAEAVRMLHQGVEVEGVGFVKTDFNKDVSGKEENAPTAEELEVLAAFEKKLGKYFVVKEDHSVPWQQPWL